MEAAPPPPDPRPPLEDERPATVGDLRALRRWVAVAGIWAVAATAVAIIALLDSSGNDDEQKVADTVASEITRIQRHLDDRIAGLQHRVGSLPTSDDLKKLERRVAKVEDGSSATRDDLKKLDTRVKDLETRVKKVETSSSTGGSAGTSGGTTTTP